MTQPQHTDLHVTWSQYYQLIETLAVQIHESDWAFDQILCLARGGLRIGDTLSRIYHRPLAILAASSYSGAESRIRGELHFAQTLTASEPMLGDRLLIVDDLVDSGETLTQTLSWLEKNHQFKRHNCRTAVLWCKACSKVTPDYYVEYLPQNPWIHQPFEAYENRGMPALIAQFQTTGSMLTEES